MNRLNLRMVLGTLKLIPTHCVAKQRAHLEVWHREVGLSFWKKTSSTGAGSSSKAYALTSSSVFPHPVPMLSPWACCRQFLGRAGITVHNCIGDSLGRGYSNFSLRALSNKIFPLEPILQRTSGLSPPISLGAGDFSTCGHDRGRKQHL